MVGPKKQDFFLLKINTLYRILYFVNTMNESLSKDAKIALSKSIFYVKNHPNLVFFFN